MAKPKATKLQSFFEGRRRKAFLVAWSHLRTKAGESRIKLELRLPLLNEPVLGISEAIHEAYSVMAKEESRIDRTSLNVELVGMTLEAFSTDTVKPRAVSSTGVRMTKLALAQAGEGEKRELNLLVVAYVPASIELRDWAWIHLHKQFHIEAVYSQTEMDFEVDGSGDGDEEPAKPAKAKKSGPAELKAFHEKQVN